MNGEEVKVAWSWPPVRFAANGESFIDRTVFHTPGQSQAASQTSILVRAY